MSQSCLRYMIAFWVGAVSALACKQCDVFVDGDVGNDASEGSSFAPLRSIHAAQLAARTLRRDGADFVTVHIRGNHALDKPLVLDHNDKGVKWRSHTADRAIVHGGVQIPVSAFSEWKGSILVADLRAFPHLRLGELSGGESLGECKNNKADLYLNGRSMNLARYPNIGLDGFWQFLNAAETFASGDGVRYNANGSWKIGERVHKWSSEPDLYLHGYWKYDWADNHVKVAQISTTNYSIMIDQSTPPLYGTVLKNARFFALNALSELDAPGEYFIDRSAKKLYFLPPGGALGPSDVVMLSNLSVVVEASSTSDIHLENIDIQYGSNQNLKWASITDSSIHGCNLGCTGGNSMSVSGKRIQIVNNSAAQIGCKGFIINGGDTATLTRGDISVEGNHIEAFSQWKRTYMPGLAWSGVGNVYRRNTLRNGPHTAAQGGGNDNLFDGNLFDTLAYEVDDTGAWYAGRTWAKRNNTLINNVFVNVTNKVKTYLGAPSVQAVYNDDQLSGNTFRNNTFIDCHCGIFIGGGRHHMVEGNVFIRTETPVHVDDRGMTWQKDYCSPPDGHFWEELNSLHYKEPPYSTHYPDLLHIDRPCLPVHNSIWNNIYCGSSDFIDISKAQAAIWNITVSNNVESPDTCKHAEHRANTIFV